MSGVCCLAYIKVMTVTVTAAVVALGGKAFVLTSSLGPQGASKIHITPGGINRATQRTAMAPSLPHSPPLHTCWPSTRDEPRVGLLSPSNWQHPLAGDFKHSHSGCYFLWLLWPSRPFSLFLDLQKCQDGQVSVTGSLGPWSNSWGMCDAQCLKGSAVTEPPREEWTANPLIQWNLFLLLGEPMGQGEATVPTLTCTPFCTLQIVVLSLHQLSFQNDEPPTH